MFGAWQGKPVGGWYRTVDCVVIGSGGGGITGMIVGWWFCVIALGMVGLGIMRGVFLVGLGLCGSSFVGMGMHGNRLLGFFWGAFGLALFSWARLHGCSMILQVSGLILLSLVPIFGGRYGLIADWVVPWVRSLGLLRSDGLAGYMQLGRLVFVVSAGVLR